MKLFFDAYQYYLENQGFFWEAMGRHLALSLAALAISVLIGVPLGIWISRRARAAELAINGFSALRLVPSLAILFLTLPYLGTGFRPALFALTVLAVPPVLINTYAGIRNVDRAVIEGASGMGMEPAQVLRQIALPIALPAIIAGIRTTPRWRRYAQRKPGVSSISSSSTGQCESRAEPYYDMISVL